MHLIVIYIVRVRSERSFVFISCQRGSVCVSVDGDDVEMNFL